MRNLNDGAASLRTDTVFLKMSVPSFNMSMEEFLI